MSYREHDCVGCKEAHDAAVWYHRHASDTGRREYLCREEYHALTVEEKRDWLAVKPSNLDAAN